MDIGGDPLTGAEAPVEEVSLNNAHLPGKAPRGLLMSVMLDVPRDLILFVSGLLAARRREIGTRKGNRRLGCYRQALFGLASFRDKGDIPRLGAGFGLSQSTACRYLDEVIEVLAARAPGLAGQLERALADGTPYLILDGKVVDTDRCREKTTSRKGRRSTCGTRGRPAMSAGTSRPCFTPPASRCGFLTCFPALSMSWPPPGERPGDPPAVPASHAVLADPGYEGAGHGVHVPVKKPAGVNELDINTRARNALLRSALPGRARLRTFDPALADAPACHRQPGQNRLYRQGRACPGAIRAQDARVNVAEKTSLTAKTRLSAVITAAAIAARLSVRFASSAYSM